MLAYNKKNRKGTYEDQIVTLIGWGKMSRENKKKYLAFYFMKNVHARNI